jgi:hypothetical protein
MKRFDLREPLGVKAQGRTSFSRTKGVKSDEKRETCGHAGCDDWCL